VSGYRRKGPIGTKRIDINKGDAKNPEYRSRLVAQESKRDKTDDLFAATPPLEAKKLLFSIVASSGAGNISEFKIDFIDARRAYFHAKSRREVFIRLPPEDEEEGMCGKLIKAMYGTRRSAELGMSIFRICSAYRFREQHCESMCVSSCESLCLSCGAW
jgi:hypothetical protein